jgi:hypothetical protein
VLHHSFTFDNAAFELVLQALAEQPRAFVDRVVIATIEANIPSSARAAGAAAGAGGLVPLSDVKVRLVSLPYPTGLLEPVQFAPGGGADDEEKALMVSHKKSASKRVGGVDYDPHRLRPICVLLDADLARKGGGGKIQTNYIRPVVHGLLLKHGATCNGNLCSLCHLRVGGSLNTAPPLRENCAEDWPLAQQAKPTMWEALVSSSFCLEPAGDTLTRSHMYAAVLSGCIPVLFDGGLSDFDGSEKTSWAFRSSSDEEPVGGLASANSSTSTSSTSSLAPSPLNYSDFSVIYKAVDVQSGAVDVIAELSAMPSEHPERFLALRRGVDNAAAAMRFSTEEGGGGGGDAFAHFHRALLGLL